VSELAQPSRQAVRRSTDRARVLVTEQIAQGGIDRAEAEALVAATRRRALELFPGKGDTFDLVLAPRFARLIGEFVGPVRPANVVPFRRR
jgi:hypothetical protein